MSPPGLKPLAHQGLDIDRLSEAEADVDFAVPLAELPRLAQLAGLAGEMRGRAHFRRAAGIAVVELNFSGSARLQCQRCLGAMEVQVEASTEVGLVATEADVSRVPEELEPVLAPGGRISVGDLVEEELLLTLPIVPLHTDEAACQVAPGAAAASADEAPPETQKPFAQLAELLKRQ
jgi:uncharacterized protein